MTLADLAAALVAMRRMEAQMQAAHKAPGPEAPPSASVTTLRAKDDGA